MPSVAERARAGRYHAVKSLILKSFARRLRALRATGRCPSAARVRDVSARVLCSVVLSVGGDGGVVATVSEVCSVVTLSCRSASRAFE